LKKWQLLDSSMAFDNQWFKVRQDKVKLTNGKVLDDYFIWLKGNVSMIVPITERNELVFVRQYKHGAGQIMIEYPAGFVDPGETPLETAKRELREETGYSAKLTFIGKHKNEPTKVTGIIYLYLAKNLRPAKITTRDDNEDIEVLKIPFKDTLKMIKNGKIWASETVAATFLAFNQLKFFRKLDWK